MKIDIWSDVACPFCYIGKRHLEAALEQFPNSKDVQVTWHSFELDPSAKTEYEEDHYQLLANKYGMSREQAEANSERVSASGKAVGIDFDFDKVKHTNTFNAHRLIQLAHKEGKQDEMEERLFKAYFTEGKHIGDPAVLQTIAAEAGLDASSLFNGNAFTDEVRKDEAEAQGLNIRGVPFFVFDMKYAISGAQPVDVFTQTLQKVWEENHPKNITPVGGEGGVCEDGACNV
ncbi:DsbA family protein [Chitinophaga sp. GCM10012297]|uniref:DsbA family oxidoreductase n=1 Tax=Chitinophaga chungangae TaxID=2821488 RepID=A0ABS3YAL4_9BACT|nr:DsbA family oxidoreductase [Chitinophaga chungangae]MBO9151713.1 DsbA family oxidoreductase [Chitinophaga chungangae]